MKLKTWPLNVYLTIKILYMHSSKVFLLHSTVFMQYFDAHVTYFVRELHLITISNTKIILKQNNLGINKIGDLMAPT